MKSKSKEFLEEKTVKVMHWERGEKHIISLQDAIKYGQMVAIEALIKAVDNGIHENYYFPDGPDNISSGMNGSEYLEVLQTQLTQLIKP